MAAATPAVVVNIVCDIAFLIFYLLALPAKILSAALLQAAASE
jgi:hypothetical protein